MARKIFLTVIVSFICSVAAFAQGTSSAQPASNAAADAKPGTTAAASETPKKAPAFRPTKEQIKQAQAMLKDKKLYDGEATGTYNPATRTGIKGFQKDNGLKATGSLNRATLEKLGIELTESQKLIPVSEASLAPTPSSKPAKSATSSKSTSDSTGAPKRPAPFRANADQIKAAQKLLKEKSMYSGEETGTLDAATREALKKYQQASGLKAMGSLNAATLESMGIALTEAQKANVAAQAAYDAAKAPKK